MFPDMGGGALKQTEGKIPLKSSERISESARLLTGA